MRTTRSPCNTPFSGSISPRVANAVWKRWSGPNVSSAKRVVANLTTEAGLMNLTLDTWQVMDADRSCMPAGQGVGGIDEILPAGEIVRRVVAEAEATIGRLEALL